MPWSERNTTSVSSACPAALSAASTSPKEWSNRRTPVKYSATSRRTSGMSSRNGGHGDAGRSVGLDLACRGFVLGGLGLRSGARERAVRVGDVRVQEERLLRLAGGLQTLGHVFAHGPGVLPGAFQGEIPGELAPRGHVGGLVDGGRVVSLLRQHLHQRRHVRVDGIEPESAVAVRDAAGHQGRPGRLADRGGDVVVHEPMAGTREGIQVRSCPELAAHPPGRIGVHVVRRDEEQVQGLRGLGMCRVCQSSEDSKGEQL